MFYLLLENFNNLETTVKNSFSEILKCQMCTNENNVTVKVSDQL